MNQKQVIVGLLIVAAGIVTLLANFDVGQMREILRHWWPLAIIVVGLLGFWEGKKRYAWPTLITFIGVVLLLGTLEIVEVELGKLIAPAIIVGVGLMILSGARHRSVEASRQSDEDITAVLSSSSSRNNSDDYTGGAASAILGGVDIDLARATIKKEAVLRSTVFMGGVSVRVPENVIVKNRAQIIMGGIEDKSAPTKQKNAPVLYVDGIVIMGGIEIKR